MKPQNLPQDAQFLHETIQIARSSIAELAARLFLIRRDESWRGTYESWGEFVKQCALTPTSASKLCTLYERVVVQLEFPRETLEEVPWTNAYLLLPTMKDKESATKALEQASTMRREDLRQVIYEEKTGHECEHPADVQETLFKCRNCGAYHK